MLAPVQYLWAPSPDCQLCQPHTQPSVGMDDRRYVLTYVSTLQARESVMPGWSAEVTDH